MQPNLLPTMSTSLHTAYAISSVLSTLCFLFNCIIWWMSLVSWWIFPVYDWWSIISKPSMLISKDLWWVYLFMFIVSLFNFIMTFVLLVRVHKWFDKRRDRQRQEELELQLILLKRQQDREAARIRKVELEEKEKRLKERENIKNHVRVLLQNQVNTLAEHHLRFAELDFTEAMSEKFEEMLAAERQKMADERDQAERARELQRTMDEADIIRKQGELNQLKKDLIESEAKRQIQWEEITRSRASATLVINHHSVGLSEITPAISQTCPGQVNEEEKKEIFPVGMSGPLSRTQNMPTWLNAPILQENGYESKLIDIPSNGSGVAQSIHPLVNGHPHTSTPLPSSVDRSALSPRSAPSLASRSAPSNLTKESVPSSAIAIALSTIEPSTSSSSKPSQAQQYAKNVTDNEMQEQAKLDIHSVDEIKEHN